jgi:hypothetical protein
MKKNQLLAKGVVVGLCINGVPVEKIIFYLEGPHSETDSDRHFGATRKLSGHDNVYLETSQLKRGSEVLNWRSWTALSTEEVGLIEKKLACEIPPGCLLENLRISGVENFSQLPPTSRLVFPERTGRQLVLAVWEENGPCHGVGQRLQEHHNRQGLSKEFITAARSLRGVMGLVLSPGHAQVGDEVLVYPPVQ